MGARHAMREDERAWAGRQHHVDGPLSEVLRDDSSQTLGERGLRGHQGLLDVLRRVLTGWKQDVIVGVIRAGTLEDFEVDLLPDLGLDGGGIFPGGSAHRDPPRSINSRSSYAPLSPCVELLPTSVRILAVMPTTL